MAIEQNLAINNNGAWLSSSESVEQGGLARRDSKNGWRLYMHGCNTSKLVHDALL